MQQQSINNAVERLACERFGLEYVNELFDAWDAQHRPVEIKSCNKWINAGAKGRRAGRFRFIPGQLDFLKRNDGKVIFGIVDGPTVMFYRVAATMLPDQVLISRAIIESRFQCFKQASLRGI